MKYPCVEQHSEEDCGAACFATIARYYGRTFSLSRVREVVGTGQQGTTLLGLRRGAAALGFNARSVQASAEILDQIDDVPLPAIIHWKGCHWVVLFGRQGDRYIVADPATGIQYLSKKWLIEAWTDWIMLLLEPDPVHFFAQEDDSIGNMGRLWQYILPYRLILTQAFLINLVLGVLSLASPFLFQILTDDVLVRGDSQLLTTIAIAVMVISILSSGLRFVQSVLITHFAQRLELGLVLEFGRQILRLPLTYYETRRSGEIISRLRDIQEVNQLVSQVIVALPSQFCIAIVSLGFMVFYSITLTGAAIAIAAVMSASTIVLLPLLQRKVRRVLVLEAENQGVLVETFKGALTLKTTTAAPQFWEEFQTRFGRLANSMFRVIQLGIVNSSLSNVVESIGNVGLIWLGSVLVIRRELSIGQLLAFTTMNANFLALITMVIGFANELTRVKTATQRLTEVIDAVPETQNDLQKPFVKLSGPIEIRCDRLNFHHAGRLELLEDFSLHLPSGKTIALIGKSGCGKSTVAKLLAGLYPPQAGNIRLGNYNLSDIAIESLRQQVVLVPQDAHFWSRSIVQNFHLGNPHLSFEQIVAACQITGADAFISHLPEKYQTVLGEFGANLSGGQRQRLAIARAIAAEPPILILDESTAGLDPVSEQEVLDRVLHSRQGQTTILISHRPKVIRRADWLVLLDQGKVQIQGAPETLRSIAGSHLDFLVS